MRACVCPRRKVRCHLFALIDHRIYPGPHTYRNNAILLGHGKNGPLNARLTIDETLLIIHNLEARSWMKDRCSYVQEDDRLLRSPSVELGSTCSVDGGRKQKVTSHVDVICRVPRTCPAFAEVELPGITHEDRQSWGSSLLFLPFLLRTTTISFEKV